MKKRFISLALTAALLVGCGAGGNTVDTAADTFLEVLTSTSLPVGYTSEGTKWVMSIVQGVYTEDVEVDLKDDFYTAANSEWLLENNIPESVEVVFEPIDSFKETEQITKEQLKKILYTDISEVNSLSVDKDDSARYAHNLELLKTYAELASDWDTNTNLLQTSRSDIF